MAKHARSSRKDQEDKLTIVHVTLCGVRSSCNVQKWKVTVLRSSNLSFKLQECRALSSCHAQLADRRNKTLEWRLATLDASSASMLHVLEQMNAARIGVICKSYSRGLQVLLTACFQGYSFQSIFQWVFPAHTLQLPSICALPSFQDILFEQAGNSNWNKLAFLRHITWYICSVGAWKYLTWCQQG